MKTRQDKLRRPVRWMPGGDTVDERAIKYTDQLQGLQKSGAKLNLGSSVTSQVSGYVADLLGTKSDAAAIAGGSIDPSKSLSRVYGDIRTGQWDKGTTWDLLLPGVGNMLNARENRNKNNNLKNNLNMGYSQGNPGGSLNNYTIPWMAAKGGVVPGGEPVSLENKEVSYDGTMKQWDLPPHPNNSKIPFKPGTIIFSDNKDYIMPDGKTPAKAAVKYEAIVNNKNASVLARGSANRALRNIYSFQENRTRELQAKNGVSNNVSGNNIPEAAEGGTVLNTISTLAPILYNTFKSSQSAENLNPNTFQNPLMYSALETLRNRAPSLSPALQATDESIAAADANLRSTATGRGQYSSGRIALANAGMRSKSAIYAQGSQQRNQYLGEYGQSQGAYGQKAADTNLLISDLNARNAAAQQQFGAAAAGQYSQWAQIQQQMKGQKEMDELKMERLNDLWDFTEYKMGLRSKPIKPQDATVGFDMTGPAAKYKMTHYNNK